VGKNSTSIYFSFHKRERERRWNKLRIQIDTCTDRKRRLRISTVSNLDDKQRSQPGMSDGKDCIQLCDTPIIVPYATLPTPDLAMPSKPCNATLRVLKPELQCYHYVDEPQNTASAKAHMTCKWSSVMRDQT